MDKKAFVWRQSTKTLNFLTVVNHSLSFNLLKPDSNVKMVTTETKEGALLRHPLFKLRYIKVIV